jgi:integrase
LEAEKMKLTNTQVKALEQGKESGDGRNLWLVSNPRGRKRWEFRYTVCGQRHFMGLGPWPDVTLDDARDKAFELRRQLRHGVNPLAEKRVHKPRRVTIFQEVAEDAITRFAMSWGSPKQEPQWRSSLTRFAFPILGKMDVSSITAEHVRDVLEPIWHSKGPTAERVQNRIERILDYATVQKLRTGDNPARLKGNLEHLLGRKELAEKHFPALPYAEVPAFLKSLRGMGGVAARALEFVVLTATRTNETTNSTWSEIDLDNAVWTIPAERMKSGNRAHRVPLSKQAVELLKALPRDHKGDYVFMGAQPGKPIATDLRRVLVRMKRTDVTSHGFRSSFRDWVAERTSYPDVLAEKMLAHRDSNKVQAAYRRSDMLEKREPLMQDWANHCDGLEHGSKIISFKTGGKQ